MNEEIMAIRCWVENALNAAAEKRNKKGKVSDYARGRLAGTISAYQHVMVETSSSSVWKTEYNIFNVWVWEICRHSPLTVGDVIAIYDFCDRNDLLKQPDIVENVIALGLHGHSRYDITNLLKLEALKGRKWIHKGIWR